MPRIIEKINKNKRFSEQETDKGLASQEQSHLSLFLMCVLNVIFNSPMFYVCRIINNRRNDMYSQWTNRGNISFLYSANPTFDYG
jgi:hypothetical protein